MKALTLEDGSKRVVPAYEEEPLRDCPKCGSVCRAIWVDIGFGAYSQQAGPYQCVRCKWTQPGCPSSECIGDKCAAFFYCEGKSLINE